MATKAKKDALLLTSHNTGSTSAVPDPKVLRGVSSSSDRVEILYTSATENPFLVGPLESLLQCIFDHYSNRKYSLPVGPREFSSKNIEVLFRASGKLLKENIEDKLALVFISKIAPLKFLDNEIFPTCFRKAIEQKTAGEIEMLELNPALKKVLNFLFTQTYSVKEIMDEITTIVQ